MHGCRYVLTMRDIVRNERIRETLKVGPLLKRIQESTQNEKISWFRHNIHQRIRRASEKSDVCGPIWKGTPTQNIVKRQKEEEGKVLKGRSKNNGFKLKIKKKNTLCIFFFLTA